MLSKSCTRCGEIKELSKEQFPLHNKTRDGFDSWCRKCRSTYRSEIRRGHYRSVISDKALKELISTTKECVICGISEVKLCVDHDHTTGAIRGILCNNCNQGIGQFKDDPELLEFARIYLLSTQGDKRADEYLDKTQGEPHD